MRQNLGIALVATVMVLIVLSLSLFVVDQLRPLLLEAGERAAPVGEGTAAR